MNIQHNRLVHTNKKFKTSEIIYPRQKKNKKLTTLTHKSKSTFTIIFSKVSLHIL